MELHDQVDQIRTREDLVAFIYDLYRDLQRHPDEWENPDLPRYLESLSAVVADLPGYFKNQGLPMPEQPSWQLIGDLLYAAKYYE